MQANHIFTNLLLMTNCVEFDYIRSRLYSVKSMIDLFDSVTPSTILLYLRSIGLFSRCNLALCLGLSTHLTITFFPSGHCLDSHVSLHLFWHCMALLVLMCR